MMSLRRRRFFIMPLQRFDQSNLAVCRGALFACADMQLNRDAALVPRDRKLPTKKAAAQPPPVAKDAAEAAASSSTNRMIMTDRPARATRAELLQGTRTYRIPPPNPRHCYQQGAAQPPPVALPPLLAKRRRFELFDKEALRVDGKYA